MEGLQIGYCNIFIFIHQVYMWLLCICIGQECKIFRMMRFFFNIYLLVYGSRNFTRFEHNWESRICCCAGGKNRICSYKCVYVPDGKAFVKKNNNEKTKSILTKFYFSFDIYFMYFITFQDPKTLFISVIASSIWQPHNQRKSYYYWNEFLINTPIADK